MTRLQAGAQAAAAIEHRLLGVAFLVLLALLGWLTYAIFVKQFTDFQRVTLLASKAGLQLEPRADVKIRGVLVGEVLQATSTGDGARLTLGLHPDSVSTIPSDVSARIVPKTLLGEKYVALESPADPSADPISGGDVIRETRVAIEVERVLDDLYPLLRTVQPADLNHTLTAMASALEGRGDAVGENLATVDGYLERTNPQLPALVEDLRLLGEVSDVYRSAVPEIARTLRNGVVTGTTFMSKEQKIQALFADAAEVSATSEAFLERNGDNIVRLAELGEQSLPLFARYAPEYPCLAGGVAGLVPRNAESFRGHTLHINLEVLERQPRGYGAHDDPVYADDRGPDCRRLPHPPFSQQNLPPASDIPDIEDGVDEPLGKNTMRVAPFALSDLLLGQPAGGPDVVLR